MSLQVRLTATVLKTLEKTPDIPEHYYSRLYALFGELLVRALDLLDTARFNLYATRKNTRKLLKIRHKNEEYSLFPGINYCQCKSFKYHTCATRKSVFCKHVLAGFLFDLTGKLTPETVTNEQMSDLIKSLFVE